MSGAQSIQWWDRPGKHRRGPNPRPKYLRQPESKVQEWGAFQQVSEGACWDANPDFALSYLKRPYIYWKKSDFKNFKNLEGEYFIYCLKHKRRARDDDEVTYKFRNSGHRSYSKFRRAGSDVLKGYVHRRYIGQSRKLSDRMYQHATCSSENSYFHRIMRLSGFSMFDLDRRMHNIYDKNTKTTWKHGLLWIDKNDSNFSEEFVLRTEAKYQYLLGTSTQYSHLFGYNNETKSPEDRFEFNRIRVGRLTNGNTYVEEMGNEALTGGSKDARNPLNPIIERINEEDPEEASSDEEENEEEEEEALQTQQGPVDNDVEDDGANPVNQQSNLQADQGLSAQNTPQVDNDDGGGLSRVMGSNTQASQASQASQSSSVNFNTQNFPAQPFESSQQTNLEGEANNFESSEDWKSALASRELRGYSRVDVDFQNTAPTDIVGSRVAVYYDGSVVNTPGWFLGQIVSRIGNNNWNFRVKWNPGKFTKVLLTPRKYAKTGEELNNPVASAWFIVQRNN